MVPQDPTTSFLSRCTNCCIAVWFQKNLEKRFPTNWQVLSNIQKNGWRTLPELLAWSIIANTSLIILEKIMLAGFMRFEKINSFLFLHKHDTLTPKRRHHLTLFIANLVPALRRIQSPKPSWKIFSWIW